MLEGKYIFGVTKSEKTIVIYDDSIEKDVRIYDGQHKGILPYKEWRENKRNYFTSDFKWIPLKKKKNAKTQKTIEETWEEYVKGAKELRRATNGIVNLFKSGIPSATALHHFSQMTEFEPEPIRKEEVPFLLGAKSGGLFIRKNYEGPAYKYDVISRYPSILDSVHMLFPIKPGKVDTLTFPTDYPVAIYHCMIEGADRRLFRVNPENYYTTHDIRRAKELNYKIEMILDGKPNILVYDRSICKTGSQIFRKFVRYFFKLKEEKVPFAKEILTSLWGALCQKQCFKVTVPEDQEFQLKPGREYVSIVPVDDGRQCITTQNGHCPFKYSWARIGPFLRSKCRFLMSKLIEPILDDILWFHTDGFVCENKHDELKCGPKLGDLRYEGYCDNVIIPKGSNQKVKGEFT